MLLDWVPKGLLEGSDKILVWFVILRFDDSKTNQLMLVVTGNTPSLSKEPFYQTYQETADGFPYRESSRKN